MKFLRFALLLGLLVPALLPASGVQAAAPTSPQDMLMPRYFPETGFWVQGYFRQYWEANGGLFVFGYPITGVFKDTTGLYTQYFQRAVFEYHPEFAGTQYQVELLRLGAIMTAGRTGEQPFQPLPSTTGSDANCTFYQPTGHRLCFGFRNFWNSNGGLPNFGYPLSEEFNERNQPPPAGDGQVYDVQYFERARFEYHPNNPPAYQVELGLLGSEYLAQHGAPASATAREDPAMPPFDPIRSVQYGPHVGYGFNVFFRGDTNPGASQFNQQAINAVTNAGFGWVRFQAQWASVEPNPGQFDPSALDRVINQVAANHLKILLSVVGPSPGWVNAGGGIPTDTASFQALTQYLANRYAGKVQAIEIWNEENLASNTGGTVNVGQYVHLLEAGYTGVKAGNTGTIVLFGALTPTGVDDPHLAIDDVTYLQEAYAYDNGVIKKYFDQLGAHPGSNNNPPDTMWPTNPGPGPGWQNDPSFYFKRIEQIRQVMVDNGDAAKQIWLTEFGWSTANQAPGYGYGVQNTPQDQANYLVRAYQIAEQQWPWIGVMAVWNLNYAVVVSPADEKGPWGVLNADWSPRPAYTALQNMPK
ncbi:MAG TPA: beta-galactosidase [Thermomicrobiaceae bacterium]|nr:beta-galactosidase [Thermomicrobiaceae bacterium]